MVDSLSLDSSHLLHPADPIGEGTYIVDAGVFVLRALGGAGAPMAPRVALKVLLYLVFPDIDSPVVLAGA